MKHIEIGGWFLAIDDVSAIGPVRVAPPHSDDRQQIHTAHDVFDVVVDTQRITLHGWNNPERDKLIHEWKMAHWA